MSKKLLILLTLAIFGGLFLTTVAMAANEINLAFPLPQICPIPGNCPSNASTTTSIAAYITRVYQLAVAIAGILAVGMIVAGAIYISVSGGSPDKRNEGRDMIMSAVWGLVLLFGSYVILKTINPQLVVLKEPPLQNLPETAFSSHTYLAPCPAPHDKDYFCFFRTGHPDTMYVGSQSSDQEFKTYFLGAVPVPIPGGGWVPEENYTALNDFSQPCQKKPCEVKDAQPIVRSNALLKIGMITGDWVFPLKDSACLYSFSEGTSASGGNLGLCFLTRNTRKALANFINELKKNYSFSSADFGPGEYQWRITEAFPPTVEHSEDCHYDGTCFDFSRQISNVSPGAPFCNNLKNVSIAAAEFFKTVLIESTLPLPPALQYCVDQNIIASSNIHQFEHTTGFHVHIQDSEIINETPL